MAWTIRIVPHVGNDLTEWNGTVDDACEIRERTIQDVSFEEARAKLALFDGCRFERVSFINASLPQLALRNVRAEGCLAFGAAFSRSFIHWAVFENCTFSGTDFSESRIEHAEFAQCKFESANFRFSRLADVAFTGCPMPMADFSHATMSHVEFDGCVLAGSVFSGVECANVDAFGSDLSNITGSSSLRGVGIDPVQLVSLAPLLASELGLRVTEPPAPDRTEGTSASRSRSRR